MFAPDIPQMHVINHLTGQPVEGESRNVLVESARIARGAISPLSQLQVDQFSALVFPGGFGAAKNLSSFAVAGEAMEVTSEVAGVLQQFRAAQKPIGLCCISPVLAARLLPGVEVTVGNDEDPAASAIRSWGGTHIHKPVTVSWEWGVVV
jgi:enhancing lycopene biosynthesis protein 2